MNKASIVVLVTASGGPAGVNAAKLLKKQKNVVVVGVDADPLSAGLAFCDHFYVVPKFIDTKAYFTALSKIIKKHKVNIVLPTLAEELGSILQVKKDYRAFDHVLCVVSPADSCALCEDKIAFYRYIEQQYPELVPAFDFEQTKHIDTRIGKQQMYFIKPRFGRGSRGCRLVADKEIHALKKADVLKDTIVMEVVSGMEWTVDAYFDSRGNEIYMVPRERLGFSGGISAKGRTVKHAKVIAVARKVLNLFNFYGPVFIQLKQHADGSIKVIEINPRLSGGITITAASGADPIDCMIKEYRGKTLTKVAWKPVRVVRYLEDFIVE